MVTFASASEIATWDPLLSELNAKGFFCMFQRLAEGVTMCGGTSDYYILDLGSDSLRNAGAIIKMTPQLSGRILILGKPDKPIAPEGVIYAERGNVVEALGRLHTRLGMRNLDEHA